jgi:hypothetical protein
LKFRKVWGRRPRRCCTSAGAIIQNERPPGITPDGLFIGLIHNAVMMPTPEERKNRAIVNETVRTQMTPLRPAGSADRYGVPRAEE